MGIMSWIILGLIAGFIASKIVNKTGSGMTMDIALGVVGAIVGGFLASFLGIGGVTGVNIGSIIIAVIGAVHRAAGLPHGRRARLSGPSVGGRAPTRRRTVVFLFRIRSNPRLAPSLRIARFQNGARVLR